MLQLSRFALRHKTAFTSNRLACAALAGVVAGRQRSDGRDHGRVGGALTPAAFVLPRLGAALVFAMLLAIGNPVAAAEPATPAAPDSGNFMWQGVQTDFVCAGEEACAGQVTIGMGDQALCYTASNGRLYCAGRVYTNTYGTNFVDAGVGDAEQVLITATFNSEIGNNMCIKQSDGTVHCLGARNDFGLFGDGTTSPSDVFVQWGSASDNVRIGTGTGDNLCAIDSAGVVSCTGFAYGSTPAVQDAGASHSTFWESTFGDLHLDDPAVFRAGYERTTCTVQATGLQCEDGPHGIAGQVVDGGAAFDFSANCWLNSDATVECARCSGDPSCTNVDLASCSSITECSVVNESHFDAGPVLAIAYTGRSQALCGVLNDGSLWCFGENPQGMLGTGDTLPLLSDTMVAPPGAVMVPELPIGQGALVAALLLAALSSIRAMPRANT